MAAIEQVWNAIRTEAKEMMVKEPMLGSFFLQAIINQKSFADALSFQLATRLSSQVMPAVVLREIFDEAFSSDSGIIQSAIIVWPRFVG